MKLASFERPDEGDYRDLAIAISASILMKLWSVCRDLSCKIRVFALRVKRSLLASAAEGEETKRRGGYQQ